jgi:hypothetical protein
MSSIFSFGFLEKIGLVSALASPKKRWLKKNQRMRAAWKDPPSLEDVDVRTHARLT